MKNKAVFLDRDGVINNSMPQWDYVKNWGEFELIEATVKILKEYQQNGYLLVVISNQLGVAKGLMTETDLKQINRNMEDLLLSKGVKINGSYYCTHSIEDKCECRKPKPGLIFKAAEELNIDISKSIMIGDEVSDIKCGINAGCEEEKLFLMVNDEIVLTTVYKLNKEK